MVSNVDETYPKMIAVCDGYLSRFLWQSHETEDLSELWQASDLTFEDKMDWPTLLIAKLESEINFRVVARRGTHCYFRIF